MAVVTEPIILDETGQDIVTQLQAIVAGLAPNAGQISYSNATSGLSADDVQEAIDEVESNVVTVSNSLTNLMLTDNEQTSLSEISGYSSLADITISTDGLYSFSTAFDTGGGSNLILILANKLGVEMYRQSVISAPRYSAIQTPILWLKAGTYKLRATGDLTKKITYTYRT